MTEEGWYVDPYGLHDDRWISDGAPTALVRDGGVESQGPPPGAPYTGPLERVEETPPGHGEDLLRADSAEHGKPFDPKAEETAAWEAFDATSGT